MLNYLTSKVSNGCLQGFWSPDTFLSIHDYIPFPSQIEDRHYSNLIRSAPGGTTEIMVHPAYVTPALEGLFSDAHIKTQEREVLTRRSLLKLAEDIGIKTVSYRFAEH